MIFDWLTDAIYALGFRSIEERWGVWGIIWLLAGLLALAGLVILAFVLMR